MWTNNFCFVLVPSFPLFSDNGNLMQLLTLVKYHKKTSPGCVWKTSTQALGKSLFATLNELVPPLQKTKS